MFRRHVVLVDSNVLYSRTLRDWLALLYLDGEGGLFLVAWTEDILTEAMYHLRRKNPHWSGERTARIRERITETFADGRVVDFQIDGTFQGRDPHDAHVHAAAVASGADILLTANGEDFIPVDHDPEELPYEVYRPDDFFQLVDDVDPALVQRVTRQQLKYWADRRDLREALRDADAPRFAERVGRHLQRIALIG